MDRKERQRLHLAYKGIKYKRPPSLGGGSGAKVVCIVCRVGNRVSYTKETCQICGNPLYQILPRVKVPRKLASDKVWKAFIRRFVK